MKPARMIVSLLMLLLIGCQDFNLRSWQWPGFDLRSQSPEPDSFDDEFTTTVDTSLVGDYTSIAGLKPITLRGVGLVTGLDGTGGDPPLSIHRTDLYRDMQKRGVPNINEILRSTSTALVLIKAQMPPLIRPKDKFDIEVYLPPNSEGMSLNGGWLMKTYLSEQAIVQGRGKLEGRTYAIAEGPILTSTGIGDQASLAGRMQRGRIVGGAISTQEQNMALYLRNEYKGGRNAYRVQQAIGKRFHQYDRSGHLKPVANAVDDQKIELEIVDGYRDNIPRYLQVIRKIPLEESDVAQRVRAQRLERDLHEPETAEQAALQLEAIGKGSIPVLKGGLQDPKLEVQFHSAMALAYLGDASGVKVLAKAAREESAFRVFAFAALAAIEDAETFIELRKLTNERSAETRYGAFRALTTVAPNDPFVAGESFNEEFNLHVLDTEGEPMVHLTNRRKAEVVLFGTGIRFLTPNSSNWVLRAGPHIMVTAHPGSDELVVSRYEVGKPDVRTTVSTRLADVIRTVASEDYGASFPDVAQLLVQADIQRILPSRLEIDALPKPGRMYIRPSDEEGPQSKTRIGNHSMTPNLYDTDEEDQRSDKYDATEAETTTGTASLADSSENTESAETETGEPPTAEESETSSKFDLLRLFRRTKAEPGTAGPE